MSTALSSVIQSESLFHVDEFGLPVFKSGQPLNSENVARAIDED